MCNNAACSKAIDGAGHKEREAEVEAETRPEMEAEMEAVVETGAWHSASQSGRRLISNAPPPSAELHSHIRHVRLRRIWLLNISLTF